VRLHRTRRARCRYGWFCRGGRSSLRQDELRRSQRCEWRRRVGRHVGPRCNRRRRRNLVRD
jgi:hypothetical protein